MEKAFDSVWKKGLIVKLAKLKIKGNVLTLIDNFLTSRTVNLNINGTKGQQRNSEEYGLPQGSALSPILFKLYLLDILDDLEENNEIEVYKFADDGTIKIASVTTERCKVALDKVINSLNLWTKSWRMIINCNPNKTEFIVFGTAEEQPEMPSSITLSGKSVKHVKKTKVLGLTIDEDLTYIPHSKEVNKALLGKWVKICQYCNIHWGFNQRVMTQLITTFFVSSLQYAGHIWINKRNMDEINQIWYKLIKSAVGAVFNIKLSIGEVIIGVPPIAIQTSINEIKHYLKLKFKEMPEDSLKEYVKSCIEGNTTQPAALRSAMKEVFRFLAWKVTEYPADFTDEDLNIISNQERNHYFNLSPKACMYTKNCINKYTERIWYNKIRNQFLMEGESHIPRPSCTRLPIPINTLRKEEVLLMSTMYPQNLMNSFVYRHTYSAESPLCPRCLIKEQTPYHVICECNNHREEIQLLISEILGEEEGQHQDSTTLLNCSRSKEFILTSLKVLSEGEFRQNIELN